MTRTVSSPRLRGRLDAAGRVQPGEPRLARPVVDSCRFGSPAHSSAREWDTVRRLATEVAAQQQYIHDLANRINRVFLLE